MLPLPESPRARRRLFRGGLATGLLAVGLAIAFLIPSKEAPNPAATGRPVPAQLAVNTHVRLSAADRHAIDSLLDRFFPAAVDRRSPDTAWALAGPEMRSASSLAQFRQGSSPVPYYPASERNYHHWQAVDVEPNAVILDILVHPRNPKTLGTWVFSTQVVKTHGRWLVNRIYTIAVMNPPTRPATVTHELGPADYAAPPPTYRNHSTTSPGGHSLLLPVVGILALIFLIPLTLGGIALLRARRWRRSVRASGRTELPPLPSTYRRGGEEQQELASHP
ncbi:MAG: hypothetical protein ACXVQ3_07265 [Gaiellaceae bacterium]